MLQDQIKALLSQMTEITEEERNNWLSVLSQMTDSELQWLYDSLITQQRVIDQQTIELAEQFQAETTEYCRREEQKIHTLTEQSDKSREEILANTLLQQLA